ncbi:MAG: sulfotransferase family 2 domain-containing protein [Bacteroidetes bacterium]|nr:sulfotransferase family 2 domain-containing protein [Bacteroidota bacterium]
MNDTTLFLHIPRTGGTTLRDIIESQYSKKTILEISHFQEAVNQINNEVNIDIYDVIKGHFPFGVHKYLNGNYHYITFLRKPINRVKSIYRFAMKMKQHPDHSYTQKYSLNEYINSKRNILLNNGQTRLIAGNYNSNNQAEYGTNPDWLFDQAMENINNHFLFIGITEEFNNSIVILKNLLGWKTPFYSIANKTNTNKTNEENKIADTTINKFNQLDIRLFDHFRNKIKYMIEDNSELAHEIHDFDSKNSVMSKIAIKHRLNRFITKILK